MWKKKKTKKNTKKPTTPWAYKRRKQGSLEEDEEGVLRLIFGQVPNGGMRKKEKETVLEAVQGRTRGTGKVVGHAKDLRLLGRDGGK